VLYIEKPTLALCFVVIKYVKIAELAKTFRFFSNTLKTLSVRNLPLHNFQSLLLSHAYIITSYQHGAVMLIISTYVVSHR